jgi:hypothetical protein
VSLLPSTVKVSLVPPAMIVPLEMLAVLWVPTKLMTPPA